MRLIAVVPIVAVALAGGVLVGTTIAQNQPGGGTAMPGMNMPGMSTPAAGAPAAGAAGPADAAYQAAMDRMMQGMMAGYSGDADVDFARGMIAHHQGAIDMATAQLEYGKDPELRNVAQEVIKAQAAEMEFLRGWLARKGQR